MADYIKAFKQGIEAAQATDRAKKEIGEVFKELNNQLLSGLGNKISIYLKEIVPRAAITKGIKLPLAVDYANKYWAIVASNPSVDKGPVKELARWSMDRAGYPCKITWKDMQYKCEDKAALEHVLAELLQDPLVGETLYSLMKWEEPQPEKGSE
jgi:hypothetical protein